MPQRVVEPYFGIFWWPLGKLNCQLSNTLRPTSPLWVVAATVVGQSHVALNQRTLAGIGGDQNHTNSNFFWVQEVSNTGIV